MFYRKHRFNNDNVLAYFQVKDGAIIDRTHKNKNFVTNVTKFSKGGGFEYCTFDFRSYIKGTNQFKLSNNFFIEFIINQSNYNDWKALLTNNGDRGPKIFTSIGNNHVGLEYVLEWGQGNDFLNRWKVIALQMKDWQLSLYVDGVKRNERRYTTLLQWDNPVTGFTGNDSCGFGLFKQCIIVNNETYTDSNYEATLNTDIMMTSVYQDKLNNFYIAPGEGGF